MLDKVVEYLQSIGKQGEFCTKITTDNQNLKITVKGLGKIPFPISAKTAKNLIKEGKPAKFGWRDQTIYDPKVRKVWKIPKSRIQIEKRSWNKTLLPVLRQIQKNMGIPEESELSALLHEMLIYEEGHFFAAHQDTEKAEGMIGTLVILLPSDFRGGSLVIDQHGEKKIIRRPHNTDKNLTFIAFYADCFHEVKKVTSGYRIALIYNLVVKNPSAVAPEEPNKKLIHAVKQYFESRETKRTYLQAERPRWLVYLLDHQYTQNSLSWSQLKSSDRISAAQLQNVAEELGLEIYLALADVHEIWEAEQDYYYERRYSRRRRYWDYDEDDEDEDPNPEDVTTGELIDDDCKLHHWIDREGKKISFADHTVFREMLCWTKANNEIDPFDSEYEGWMGNYGNTMEYWYHRSAIVLWEGDKKYASSFAIDPIKTIEEIKKLLKKDLNAGREAIRQILPQWSRKMQINEPAQVRKVFGLAATVEDPELACKFLEVFNLEVLCKTIEPGFRKLLSTYGEEWGYAVLEKWAAQEPRYHVILLRDLLSLIKGVVPHNQKIASWLLEYQLSAIVKQDKEDCKQDSDRELEKQIKLRLKNARDFLTGALEIDKQDLHLKAIEHFLAHPRAYFPELLGKLSREVPYPWQGTKPEDWGYGKLFSEAKQRLQAQLASTKREKGDWSIKDKVVCHCSDCKHLSIFLTNSTEQKEVWPLAKRRRQHIHQVIDKMGIPVTHRTQRTGSPHKLILTKTSALFQDAETRSRRIVDELKLIEKFEEKTIRNLT